MILDLNELNRKQNAVVEKLLMKPKNFLVADCGSGKTWIAKKYIEAVNPSTCLVISPLKVLSSSWKHVGLQGFEFFESKTKKKDVDDVNRCVCNREKLKLFANKKFELVIIDESSLFKVSGFKVFFKIIKNICQNAEKVLIMTATPFTTGAEDIYSQLALIGKYPLGNKTEVYKNYYTEVHGIRGAYKAKPNQYTFITEKVKSDIIYVDVKGQDICKVNYVTHNINMDPYVKTRYDFLNEHHFLTVLKNEITCASKIVKLNKMYQILNGFVICTEDESFTILSYYKYKEIQKITSSCAGNVLFVYFYEAEQAMLKETFPDIQFYKDSPVIEDEWNKGKIKYLGINVGSCSHGLNLQHGGSEIIWCSLPDSFEKFHQANHRIIRVGQNKDVVIHLPIIVESLEVKRLNNLRDKTAEHNKFLKSLNIF